MFGIGFAVLNYESCLLQRAVPMLIGWAMSLGLTWVAIGWFNEIHRNH